jgi:ubiquinone/menaquinone biosynthesis C-methylase UbiE
MFDVAIDKSTIDALLCGSNSQLMVATMLKEAQRVIKPGGYYIAISYGKPKDRSYLFMQKFLDWKVREFKLYDVRKEEKEQKA